MGIFDLFKKQTVYDAAKECYAHYGVDTEKAMEQLAKVSISLQCWQGDDVSGFRRYGKRERRRVHCDGSISRQGANGRRAEGGFGGGLQIVARQTSAEPSRQLS